MGYADRHNPRSLHGSLPAEAEKARLSVAPLSVLVKTLFRLWWERIHG
ncbi:MAG: hypothetical protein WC876_11720 [Candidatus Thermoplasmatota archaeon]